MKMKIRAMACLVAVLVGCGDPPDGVSYTPVLVVETGGTEATGGGAGAPATGGETTGGTVDATGGEAPATGGVGAVPGVGGNGGVVAPPVRVCDPGRQVTCPCIGGAEAGVQSCSADGAGWSACACPEPPATGGAGGAAGAGPDTLCEPSAELPCECPGGASAFMWCALDGSEWGSCECPPG